MIRAILADQGGVLGDPEMSPELGFTPETFTEAISVLKRIDKTFHLMETRAKDVERGVSMRIITKHY